MKVTQGFQDKVGLSKMRVVQLGSGKVGNSKGYDSTGVSKKMYLFWREGNQSFSKSQRRKRSIYYVQADVYMLHHRLVCQEAIIL